MYLSSCSQFIRAANECICPTAASVLEPAEKFCSEGVQPYLASILEELMGPISSGFQEARLLIDNQMDQLCQDFQEGGVTDKLKQVRTSSPP